MTKPRPSEAPGAVPSEPLYRALMRSGELAERARHARKRLEDCDLCARYCRVNRLETIRGAVCRTGERAVVSSYGPHHGEEDCLRGWRGSGTIFFAWCNLRCVYCQNWEISWKGEGGAVSDAELAAMMLALQRMGCHNINLVSPSHVVAQVLGALAIAAGEGLRLPIVYNTGGYDSVEALALLDGVVDVYMPDAKYGDAGLARRYSRIRDYPRLNRAALSEMHRQVGDLVLDGDGLARRGLLVRHLVLPGGVAGSAEVARFLAEEISPDTYLNLMDQYRPCFRAGEYAPVDRPLSRAEYAAAFEAVRRCGLHRLDGRATSRRARRW